MKIPRTIPLGLLLSLSMFGALFLLRWAPLGGMPLSVKCLLTPGLMALLSMGAMALFGEGHWKDFGFQKAQGAWGKFVFYGLLLGIVMTLAVLASPGKGMGQGAGNFQILVLTLVAHSSAEEIFMWGWLQGFLQPLSARRVKLGFVTVSVPVLTGALAFGAMHLPAVLRIDAWTTVIILASTTSLGLLAGIIRERTGSLLPAIWVHLAGNAGGILGGLVFLALRRLA